MVSLFYVYVIFSSNLFIIMGFTKWLSKKKGDGASAAGQETLGSTTVQNPAPGFCARRLEKADQV